MVEIRVAVAVSAYAQGHHVRGITQPELEATQQKTLAQDN